MTTIAIRQFGVRTIKMPLVQGFIGALLAAALLYAATVTYGAVRWKFFGKNDERISRLEQNQAQIVAYLQQRMSAEKDGK